jgi:hypothetical protein
MVRGAIARGWGDGSLDTAPSCAAQGEQLTQI